MPLNTTVPAAGYAATDETEDRTAHVTRAKEQNTEDEVDPYHAPRGGVDETLPPPQAELDVTQG